MGKSPLVMHVKVGSTSVVRKTMKIIIGKVMPKDFPGYLAAMTLLPVQGSRVRSLEVELDPTW